MPKQSKKDNSSQDDRDIKRSPKRELPKSRSEQSQKIIALLKKIDQPTMAHDNRDSYIKYLSTVEKRLVTYDVEDEKFVDYEDKKSKVQEKATNNKGTRKSNRKK